MTEKKKEMGKLQEGESNYDSIVGIKAENKKFL